MGKLRRGDRQAHVAKAIAKALAKLDLSDKKFDQPEHLEQVGVKKNAKMARKELKKSLGISKDKQLQSLTGLKLNKKRKQKKELSSSNTTPLSIDSAKTKAQP